MKTKSPVTLVNEALKKAGRAERLVRGRGYYYLMHGEAPGFYTSGIYQSGFIDFNDAASSVEQVFADAGITINLRGIK